MTQSEEASVRAVHPTCRDVGLIISEPTSGDSRLSSVARLHGLLFVLVGTGIILAGCAVWAVARFHNLHSARAYFRGQILEIVDARMTERMGSGHTEVLLRVRNNAPVEVSVVGARTDCHCIEPRGLPLAVPPLSDSTLSLALVDEVSADFDRRIILYTNTRMMPELYYTMSRQLFGSDLALVGDNRERN